MDKNDIIATLRNSMRSHKQWVGNALALIEGVPLDKEKVPVNYGDGQQLKIMLSAFRARLMAAQAALDACSILLDQLDAVHADCGAVLAALAAKKPDCGLLQ